jgi:hypothetical protein
MPEKDDPPKDWKLRLRYGRLQTPYRHFTTISEGVFGQPSSEFGCAAGPAFMTMRVWASDADEAVRVASAFGREIGFSVTGRVYLHDTPAEEPPRDHPYGYGIAFTPYDPER